MNSTLKALAAALAVAVVTSAAPTTLHDRAAISTAELANMQFYAQYAATSYCNSNNAVGQAVTCSGNACPTVTSHKATTSKTFRGILTDIQGLIAIDPVNALIVVSFRGSHSIRNWMTNIVFNFADCTFTSNCQVHDGFATAWAEISSSVLSGVQAARAAHPSYKIISTGHSLGGAIATLGAASLRQSGYAVDLYTYGSPRVGNAAFTNFVTAQPGLEVRVTHLDDPVPRLPPLFLGYRHTSPEYWLSAGTAITTNYGVADVKVCTGSATVACNAGTFGMDIVAHLNYFEAIAGCSPVGMPFRRGEEISDADLETRLNMYTSLDIQYAQQLEAKGSA